MPCWRRFGRWPHDPSLQVHPDLFTSIFDLRMATVNSLNGTMSPPAEDPVAMATIRQPDGGKFEVKYLYQRLKDGKYKIADKIETEEEEDVDGATFGQYPVVSI